MSYANITNPANFQLQDFAQFGFRVITTDFIPVPGEQYRTLYVLQDAVVTATTQKGDDITSKAILAGTLLHGLFNSVSITSGRVLAYAAGRVTADEIIALYEAYVVALGGTLENTQCAIDTLNDTGVDFFADASLVMIPEGYATGVVYGQRPLTSDSQLTFTRASTATRVGPDGAIAVVGSNVPRIDYTGGGCGKLLLEPQRTNLVTYSEQFNNAAWDKSNITVTANAAISPDGTTNADLLNITSVSNYIDQAGTIVSGSTYTVSCYVKSAVSSSQTFILYGNANKSSSAFTATQEWQRFTHTFTADSTAMSSGIVSSALVQLYAYGFQLELGAYATSYIPTTAAAVTRLADACYSGGDASTFNDSEGVIFAEIAALADDLSFRTITLSDGTTDNNVGFGYRNTSNVIYTFLKGVINSSTTVIVDDIRDFNKVAVKYKSGDYAFWVNGIEVYTSTTAFTLTGLSELAFDNGAGAANFYGNAKQILIFPTVLTDAQLAELTSL
jgi:hypothetical protein